VGRRWAEDVIRRELEAFLPGFDTFPHYSVIRASARRGLWQAMATGGGPERFAAEYGLAYAQGPSDRRHGLLEATPRIYQVTPRPPRPTNRRKVRP
jgi:hypothetical protein